MKRKNKIIITDYSSSQVYVINSTPDPETCFQMWCEANGVRTTDCDWMEFDGTIQIME